MPRDSPKELVVVEDLHWHAKGETPRAICVSQNGVDKIWLAKSLCPHWEVSPDGKSVDVTVEEWLAKKEDLL